MEAWLTVPLQGGSGQQVAKGIATQTQRTKGPDENFSIGIIGRNVERSAW